VILFIVLRFSPRIRLWPPLRTVSRLRIDDVLRHPEPLMLRSNFLQLTFKEVGLDSFAAMRKTFGNESIIVGEEDWAYSEAGAREFNFSSNQEMLISQWIDSLLEAGSGAQRLSAIGGTDFFFRRPELLDKVVAAFHTVVPSRYHTMYRPKKTHNWRHAWKDWVDLMLWAADESYVYTIHQDYVVGNVLYHIAGRKRVRLFAPDQQEMLFLHNDKDPEIWEANSLVPIEMQSGEIPLPSILQNFSKARYIEVELQSGDALFLPCTWAHQVFYDGPAISVAYSLGRSSPRGCADLIPGAQDKVVSAELFDAISAELWGDDTHETGEEGDDDIDGLEESDRFRARSDEI